MRTSDFSGSMLPHVWTMASLQLFLLGDARSTRICSGTDNPTGLTLSVPVAQSADFVAFRGLLANAGVFERPFVGSGASANDRGLIGRSEKPEGPEWPAGPEKLAGPEKPENPESFERFKKPEGPEASESFEKFDSFSTAFFKSS